jgi:Collagen triple helix repeat (20 copies)
LSYRAAVRLLSIVLATLASTAAANAAQVALIGDASVSTARPSTNFGTLANLYVGNGSSALLQFDLGTLPAGTTSSQIAHATLTLFVNRVNAAGSVTLSPATSAWSESSVTSTTTPSIGATSSIFLASAPGQYVTLDVTALVQGWVTTPATNFGFALTSDTASLLLDSKENDETGHAATLDITITSQGATGPQGIQGPQGPTGTTGANGANGAPGPIGPQGVSGPIGPLGPVGPTGTTGANGAPGPIGPQGIPGSTGPAGPLGPTGITGPIGPTGAIGTTGATGAIGPIGPNGLTGPAGSIGATGSTGPIGPNGLTGPTGLTGSPGPAGAPGPIGATGTFSQAGNWSSATTYQPGQVVFCAACSTDGSSYIALVANTNQDPPAQTGVWQLIAQAGATGSIGLTGATGATGSAGTNGTNGAPGATGPTGPTGPAGASGNSSYLFLFSQPGTVSTGGSVMVNAVGNGVTVASGFTLNNGNGNSTAQGSGLYWFYFSIQVPSGSNSIFLVEVNGNNIVGSAVVDAPGLTPLLLTTNGSISLNTGDTVNVVCVSGCGTYTNATLLLQPLGAAGAAGATGAIGATGATGPQGPQGPIGPAGANGTNGATGVAGNLPQVTAYNPATTYAQGSAVVYQGSTYQSVSNANANNLPTNPTFWTLIAQAGTTGATGPAGPAGSPGLNGADGANGTGTVSSVTVGTVSNTAAPGAGTLTINNSTTTPSVSINFPSTTGFVWTTSFPAPTDQGPDNVNPLTGAIGLVPALGITQTQEFAFAPVACIATSLQAYGGEIGFSPLPFPTQVTVTVQDNRGGTAMSCQLSLPPGQLGSSTCSSTNRFSVNAGDEIQYSVSQTSPVPGVLLQLGATLTCQ